MRQSILTGLMVTAAALCGVVLFVILLTVLNRSSVVLPNAVTVAPVVHDRNTADKIMVNPSVIPSRPMPATEMVTLANELLTDYVTSLATDADHRAFDDAIQTIPPPAAPGTPGQ